jgi:hypothetical protein
MKKLKILSITLFVMVLAAGCGTHRGAFLNNNNNTTQVELGEKNFKVVSKVSGQSTATYVLGIGGITNKSLVENARSNMMSNADIVGSSKAIINMTTESHSTLVYPFFYQKTITVSGYVVEFTD